ncbi:MAG: DUF547 domain-containing protein [Flavobacteriaceae bacterium]|nr:DUF547 domain-containing protein [Flavobacteriaceae bacterium]
MKLFTLLAISGLLFLSFDMLTPQKNLHQQWDSMLKKYVSTTGKVDYQNWKEDPQGIEQYISHLEKNTPLDKWSKEQKLAYWINAYNAVTVKLILDHYPIHSIRDIEEPWNTKLFSTAGNDYTLDEIEHDIIRKMNEPRIHFAVNCTAKSCPKLQKSAFTSSDLEEQLEKATFEYLNDHSMNIVNQQSVQLSKIFEWFGEDFGDKKEKIEFVEKYTKVDIDPQAKLSYLPYNWELND